MPHIDHRLTMSDQRRLANCTAFHDLAEVLIGDYPAYTNTRRSLGYERTTEELMRLEEAANTLIRPWLGQQLLLDFDDAMSILKDSTLRLSKFVTLIDKIDPIIAIWRYLYQFRAKLDITTFLTATDHFFSNSNVRRVCEGSDIDRERMCAMIEFLQNPGNAKRYFVAEKLPGHIAGLEKGFPVGALIEGTKLTFVRAPRK